MGRGGLGSLIDPGANTAVTITHTPPLLGRWRALDLFRLLAVVLMVQGHVFTALLDPVVREASWFRGHNYVHGLTAPIFFLSSGVAFGVATFRQWSFHTHAGTAVRRRLERYGWLLFIGYMLSLPQLSFRQLLSDTTGDNARAFFQVGALENIAVSLVIAQALVWLLKRRLPFIAATGLLAAALVFCAPAAWRLPVEDWLPVGFAAYVNADTGSLFPLFPWTGFLFFGVIAAYLCMKQDGRLRRRRSLGLALSGLSLWLGADLLEGTGVNVAGDYEYWKTSPIFFFTRLGLVLLSFAALCGLERWLGRSLATPRAPDRVARLGQETLVIYVAHLFLLYGSPVNPGLTKLWEPTLSVAQGLAVSAILLLASTGIAALWRQLRTQWPQRFRMFQLTLAVAVLLVALVKP
ncbi:MAG: heparan-alpha-glucosaminide N-acetyltransferase domain-containing protein [Polyangiales bacterium]